MEGGRGAGGGTRGTVAILLDNQTEFGFFQCQAREVLGEQLEVALRLHVKQGPLYVQVNVGSMIGRHCTGCLF